MWSSVIEKIEQGQRFVISSHLNPDCDALGSELALAHHLIALGKEVAILNADAVPSTYQFLDPTNLISTFSSRKHAAVLTRTDTIIVVDVSGGWERLGRVGRALSHIKAATTLCIDHHPNGDPFTDISVVEPGVSATGELIFDLIVAMGGKITPEIAQSLYAAIITDSGSFRFSNTTPKTHLITAQLIEGGANPTRIYELLYEQLPLSRVKLKGYVLQNIQMAGNGQIACIALTLEDLKTFDVASSELDGFSGLPQQINGVRVSIFLVELPRGRVKISLRSNGSVAVNKLAALFGGGGHVPAAGAIAQGAIEVIAQKLIAATEALLEA